PPLPCRRARGPALRAACGDGLRRATVRGLPPVDCVRRPQGHSGRATSVRRVDLLRPSDDPATAVAQLSSWLEADDPAPLLIETSGSTGHPKRVVLSREAVLASVRASAARLGASGPWLLALPSSYVAGVQ